MRRIAAREVPGAPHETLLVLDATTGVNGLVQARRFVEAAARDRSRPDQARRERAGRDRAGDLSRAQATRFLYVGVGEARGRPRALRAGGVREGAPRGRCRKLTSPGLDHVHFALAERGRYSVSPNPMRGRASCAAAASSERVSTAGPAARTPRSWRSGRPDALRAGRRPLPDPRALRAPGPTPPCAPAVIAAGVGRVVVMASKTPIRSFRAAGSRRSGGPGSRSFLRPGGVAPGRAGNRTRSSSGFHRERAPVRARQVGLEPRRPDRIGFRPEPLDHGRGGAAPGAAACARNTTPSSSGRGPWRRTIRC